MWQPILTPVQVIFIFLAIGISFVPTGVYLSNLNNTIYEDTIIYDGGGNDASTACGITTSNAGRSCEFSYLLTADVKGDLLVYYELDNFYQNHRLYVKSYSNMQLLGEFPESSELDTACTSKVTDSATKKILHPCGLIANSFFNDIIRFDYVNSAHNTDMDETNIAWPSDYDKFKQPDGFMYEKLSSTNQTCADVGLPSDCSDVYTDSNGVSYRYYYPNSGDYKYLYESYSQIDPILGVTDEHFMVWFRTAARPKFRKLYGRIKGDFSKGQELKFAIRSNFEVASFGGTKALVISSLSEMGGVNPYLGTAYLVVGILAFLLTLLFIFKQVFSERRKMNGDLSLLRWED